MFRATLLMLLLITCRYAYSQENAKDQLFGKWELNEYEVQGEFHQPTSEDNGDYLLLEKNMSFESKSEGKIDFGTWKFLKNKNTIILTDENKDSLKVVVVKKENNSLILWYDVKDLKEILFHYKK
ncbi:hypothetical protein SAMN04489761_2999 [Tenacibaculum sp. MAR_2009_124]|uniref:hypothetical protein n=1 Tax=Tenacibaculum sp. MAR_2009_124 TaxID=1250059 RepID=UPI0008999CAC|nr:hypothetical protein [Tenacibaculum sp. MAR_2009_124]SEC44034.1 hypothetical protein SAMN04489761_2999 [Tenacibaculum sp. MAR_2009_124]